VRVAKDYGKKVVMTPLLPYLSPTTYLRHWLGLVEGRKRLDIDMLRYVDVMLVVNQLQLETASRLYGFPRRFIKIIPTILNPIFFDCAEVHPPLDDFQPYVACAGNILSRKNQIRLAQAAVKVGCGMVFAGNSIGGEDEYAEAFRELVAAHSNLKWYRWLTPMDIYRLLSNATAIALPSFKECQPTIGLEAAALQKPLLLADKPYAHQEFYAGAKLVDPKSVDSIADGLSQILTTPSRFIPRRDLVNECRSDIVAVKLRAIFEDLVSV
jgi:glycosyltransferase involved in cell wall biosynthesis